MSNRRSLFSLVAVIACMGLALTTSFGDDLLGKKGGGGGQRGGGSSSGGSSSGGGGGSQRGGGGSSGGDVQQRGGDRQRGGGGGDSGRGGGGSSGGQQSGGDRQRGGGGNEGGRGGGGNRDRGNGGGDNQRGGGGSQQSGGSEVRSGGSRIYIPPSNSGNQNNGNDLFGKRGGGRSGNSNYGSNSNSRARDRNAGPERIGRAPVDVIRGSLTTQVRRSDTVRIGGTTIRFGYTHYDYRWRDDYFCYPHYVFDPYAYNSYCSPWYYYPQLPPYFLASRCYVVPNYYWSPFIGVSYTWYPPSNSNTYYNNGRRLSDFDYAIDDIVNSFENDDRRAVSRLVPRSGRVAILIDGKYAYSMNADDFYDTLLDATQNSKTTDYKILDVQTNRDGAAVWARHDFEDPWGRRESVYHYFRLEQDGRDWVIREFGTSENRW